MTNDQDISDEVLAHTPVLPPANADGVLPVMAVAPRASSSAALEAKARAIDADPARYRLVPFIEDGNKYTWTEAQQQDMAALGLDPDLVELAYLEEQLEAEKSK
jgi:hypothetical protein